MHLHLRAERAQHGGRALEPVGLLEPQAGGVDDLRLAVRERGDDAQHRDQIRDGRSVDRDAAQHAAPNGDGILRLAHIRAEAAQHIQHRAVALRRVGRKARDRDAGGRERAHRQEKRSVRPVALHMAPGREARRLAAGDGVRPLPLLQADAGQAQRVLRHGDVARGLEPARHGERALPRQARQRHEQAGDVLRGHVARQRIGTGPQPAAGVQQRAGAPDGHAVRREHRVEG